MFPIGRNLLRERKFLQLPIKTFCRHALIILVRSCHYVAKPPQSVENHP